MAEKKKPPAKKKASPKSKPPEDEAPEVGKPSSAPKPAAKPIEQYRLSPSKPKSPPIAPSVPLPAAAPPSDDADRIISFEDDFFDDDLEIRPADSSPPASKRPVSEHFDLSADGFEFDDEFADLGIDDELDAFEECSDEFPVPDPVLIGESPAAAMLNLPKAQQRGDFTDANPEAMRYDPVDCTVFAPRHVGTGVAIVVQVFAHLVDDDASARRLAQDIDEWATTRGRLSLGTRVPHGSKLSFELSIPEFQIQNPVQHLTWRGRLNSVQFGVRVPSSVSSDSVLATVQVFQDSVPIGTICFTISLNKQQRSAPTAVGESRRFQYAFVSYASSDRAEVLRRVQMLRAVGIRIFQDVLDLQPGKRWAMRLYEKISECDVLFLFWSTAAKQSEWVEKEWRHCLELKGEDFIMPIVIEGPPIPDPPAELAHLHFGDPLLYFLRPSPLRGVFLTCTALFRRLFRFKKSH